METAVLSEWLVRVLNRSKWLSKRDGGSGTAIRELTGDSGLVCVLHGRGKYWQSCYCIMLVAADAIDSVDVWQSLIVTFMY